MWKPLFVAFGGAVVVAASLTGCSALPAVSSATTGPAPAGTPGGSVQPTNVDVFHLVVGQCLNDAGVPTSVDTVPGADCSIEHDSEVIATFDLPDGDYPGSDAVNASARAGCQKSFFDYVGEKSDDSRLTMVDYIPLEQSWASGDRQVVCVVHNADGSKLHATVAHSANRFL